MSASTSSKTSKLIVKHGSASAWLGEGDWRGIVALTLVAGYVALLIQRVEGVEVFGVAVGLVVGWYFGSRRPWSTGQPQIVKLPLASEKHPEFIRIRNRIVEALKATGQYAPALDDWIINESAKTVLDIRTVDRYISDAANLGNLREAVKAKAQLVGMLFDSLHNLAASRLDRVSRREMVHFQDTMQKRMMEIMAESASQAENDVQ